MWFHLPAACWGALIEFFGWRCPLTPWEIELRRRAGEAGYERAFIERYMLPILYPGELTREVQVILGACVVVVNVFAYGVLVVRHRRRRRRGPPQHLT